MYCLADARYRRESDETAMTWSNHEKNGQTTSPPSAEMEKEIRCFVPCPAELRGFFFFPFLSTPRTTGSPPSLSFPFYASFALSPLFSLSHIPSWFVVTIDHNFYLLTHTRCTHPSSKSAWHWQSVSWLSLLLLSLMKRRIVVAKQ